MKSTRIYVFSKGIKCLEQNFQKQIDCKKPLSTKQICRIQNISTETCKQKYNHARLVLAVFASSKLALNYITQARRSQLVSRRTLATWDFHKHLTIKQYGSLLLAIFGNIFLLSHILLLFHSPKSREVSCEKLRKYLPYRTPHRAITAIFGKKFHHIYLTGF